LLILQMLFDMCARSDIPVSCSNEE